MSGDWVTGRESGVGKNHPCLATKPTSLPTYSVCLTPIPILFMRQADRAAAAAGLVVRATFPTTKISIYPSIHPSISLSLDLGGWMLGRLGVWMLGWLRSWFFDSTHLSICLFIHRSTDLLVHLFTCLCWCVCMCTWWWCYLLSRRRTVCSWGIKALKSSKFWAGPELAIIPHSLFAPEANSYHPGLITLTIQNSQTAQPPSHVGSGSFTLFRTTQVPILVGAAQPCATSLTYLPYCLRYSLLPCLVNPLVLVLGPGSWLG